MAVGRRRQELRFSRAVKRVLSSKLGFDFRCMRAGWGEEKMHRARIHRRSVSRRGWELQSRFGLGIWIMAYVMILVKDVNRGMRCDWSGSKVEGKLGRWWWREGFGVGCAGRAVDLKAKNSLMGLLNFDST
ncbi:unnamed protein product [Linum trigynum]|uniref:Uncharacterized protein n=1 Tax=Linum trigynum TaxID=586398 RepID=A0AAV2FNL7_9ROSI